MAALSADVAIVGAGPAGSAAAIALARAGARVVLLERDATARFKPGEILEPTIKYSLAELGLSSAFAPSAGLSLHGKLSIWGSTAPVEADVTLNPHGAGHLVDRRRVEDWLIAEAQRAGVIV